MPVLYYFHVYTRSLSAFKHCSKSFPRAVESSHIPAKSTLARVLFLIESTSISSLYKGTVSASITTQLNSTEHKYQYTTWGDHFLCSLFIYFYIYFFLQVFLLKKSHNTQCIHFIRWCILLSNTFQLHYLLDITRNESPLIYHIVYFFYFNYDHNLPKCGQWACITKNSLITYSKRLMKSNTENSQLFDTCFYLQRGVHMHSSDCTSLSSVRTELFWRLPASKMALQG